MKAKSLQNLNLIDNFLFSATMENKQHGRIVAENMLSIILDRKVDVKEVIAEAVMIPGNPDRHGVRLDALIEEDETEVSPGDIFDIEPDKRAKAKGKLSRRTRYYHSRLDSKSLQAGRDYTSLPDTWVIFITPFDPFGKDLMVYTVKNQCLELSELEYNDGATTLFLYIYGKKGKRPKSLQELLHYMGETTSENAVSSELKTIQECIEDIKRDPKVKEAYMTFEEYIDYERREAAEEAIEEEKARADAAETRANKAEAHIALLEKRIAELEALMNNVK